MENFIFKYIDIDADVLDQIMLEIKKFHTFKNFETHNFTTVNAKEAMPHLPTLEKWFQQNNLTPYYVAHMGQAALSEQDIHVDSGDNSLALNFPIDIVEECATLFFEKNGEIETRYTPVTNVKYLKYVDHNPMVEIGRYTLTKPTLINVGIPHAIRNGSKTNMRYCFSFRFKEDPWHLVKDKD